MTKYINKKCKRHGYVEHYFSFNMKYPKCKKCNIEGVSRRRRKAIHTVKNEHGGCCVLCGYNKCLNALSFHHRDSSTKSFGIAQGNTRSINKLREEAKKCDLVCSNCHAEIHAGLHELDSGM